MTKINLFKLPKISFPKEVGIFLIGLFAGIVAGIAIKTGLTLNPGDISLLILKQVCRITDGSLPFNCYAYITLISFVVAILAFIPLWKKARLVKQIRINKIRIPGFVVGLGWYFIGFVLGNILLIKLWSLL